MTSLMFVKFRENSTKCLKTKTITIRTERNRVGSTSLEAVLKEDGVDPAAMRGEKPKQLIISPNSASNSPIFRLRAQLPAL